MAGSKSDYAEKIVLDMFLGGVVYAPPASVWVALSVQPFGDNATGAGFNEVLPDLGYERIEVPNTLDSWPAATGDTPSVKTNADDIVFGTATGAGWGTVQSAYILDAEVEGNVIYGADLNTPTDVGAGSSITILAGTYLVTEN